MTEGADQPRLNIDIEQVVLDGVDPTDWRLVESGMRDELARLVERDGLPASFDGEVASEPAVSGPIEVPADAEPRAIGRAVARTLYERLTGRPDQGGRR